jgi:hypothetical protein
MPSFCAIKLYYVGIYCGIAVNYHGKTFYTMVANFNTLVFYCDILTQENLDTAVNYHYIAVILASVPKVIKLFTSVI